MRFFDLFRKVPDVIDVSFPLPYHWKEYPQSVSFDIRAFDDPKVYSKQLSLMSFGFALSCFTAMDLNKNGAVHAISYLEQARFKKIHASDDYAHQATSSSLGFVFGMRKYKKGKEKVTLIALGIRGGHYGAEWASNARLGESGPHQGFLSASERIYEEFLNYLRLIKAKGKIAIWTVGYSRAGGVAALFADKLSRGMVAGGPIRKFGKAKLDLDHIFAYTFAAPQAGEWNGDEYTFIHNIINPEDLVPRLPFTTFGFGHYGYEHFLQCSDEKAAQILSSFEKEGLSVFMPTFLPMKLDYAHLLNPAKRFSEDFSRVDGQRGFLDQLCGLISNKLSRAAYAKYIQEGMADLASLVDEMSDTPYDKFLRFLRNVFDGLTEDYGILSLFGKMTSEKTQWKAILTPYVENALEYEPELEDQEEEIVTALAGFLHFLCPTKKELLDLYPTLREKENAKAIAFAHEPVRYYMLLLAQ